MWILFGLLSAITAALMTICAKIGLKNIDPTFATAIRSGIMFVFMMAVVTFSGKIQHIQTLQARSWRWIVAAGVFGALSWLFYFIGLGQTSASKLAALDRLSLPLIILFSALLLSEKVTWPLAVGGLLVTVGAVLIARA